MNHIYKTLYASKKVLIWGLGVHGGGIGATRFFAACGADVTVTDLADEVKLAESLQKLSDLPQVKYVLGRHDEDDFFNADIILMNPAIKPSNDLYKRLRDAGKKIETDYGIFLQHFPGLIVGITGSKGKSTLTQHVFHLLTKALDESKSVTYNETGATYSRVMLGGNIRVSMLDTLTEADDQTIAVLELSSFMLEQAAYIERSPHISFITNLYNEHIEWHGDFEAYVAAKENIVRYQTGTDLAILSEQAEPLIHNASARVATYDGSLKAALTVFADEFGIGQYISEVMASYRTLEGRQEFVAEVDGVRYINDTTATHPSAVEYALQGLLKTYQGGQIILIAGGTDKGFGEEVERVARLTEEKNIFVALLPGTFSDRLREYWSQDYQTERVYPVETMLSAVNTASKQALPGDVVILSPGGSSFNLFANEFDRGAQFVHAVKILR